MLELSMPDLTMTERAAAVRKAVASLRLQHFQARVDLAANIGNAEGEAQLRAQLAQLARGLANVEREFAAELAAPAEEEPTE
jgi:hypothetical protein